MEELNHVINSNIRWIGGVDDLTEMIVTERVKEEIVPQINSRGEIDALSVVEKDISIRDLIYSRIDAISGEAVTDIVAFFIVVGCAATSTSTESK